MNLAKTGAALYILWGVMHLGAAAQVWGLASTVEEGMVSGRLQQNAWHLGMIAILASVVAVLGNWRNDRTAFWANLWLVGLTDIGFLLLILAPGYMPLFPGLLGPAVWLAALTVSALALRGAPRPATA